MKYTNKVYIKTNNKSITNQCNSITYIIELNNLLSLDEVASNLDPNESQQLIAQTWPHLK